jgi:hypothetical protein
MLLPGRASGHKTTFAMHPMGPSGLGSLLPQLECHYSFIKRTRHTALPWFDMASFLAAVCTPLTLLDAQVWVQGAHRIRKPGAVAVFHIDTVYIASHAIPAKARSAIVVPIRPDPAGSKGPRPAIIKSLWSKVLAQGTTGTSLTPPPPPQQQQQQLWRQQWRSRQVAAAATAAAAVH